MSTIFAVILVFALIGFMLACVRESFRERISLWFMERPGRIWLLPALSAACYLLLLFLLHQLTGAVVWRALVYFFVPTWLIARHARRSQKVAFGVFEFLLLAFIAAPPSWGWLPNYGILPHSIDLLKIQLPTCGWIVAIYLFLIFRYWKKRDLHCGWKLSRTDFKLVGLGFLTATASIFPLAYAVHFIVPGMQTIHSESNGMLLLNGAGVFLATALPEELIFRGFVQNLISEHLRGWYGIFAAALIFGFAHITQPLTNSLRTFSAPNWWYVFFAATAGLSYGYVYKKRIPSLPPRLYIPPSTLCGSCSCGIRRRDGKRPGCL